MSAPTPDPLSDRIAELERQVRELRARLAALERASAPRVDNPADQRTIREKAVYDWQS